MKNKCNTKSEFKPKVFSKTPLVYTKILDFRALWGPKRSRKKEINHHGQRVYGGIVWLDQIFHQGCIAFHRSIVKTGPTWMKRRKNNNLVLTGLFFFKICLLNKNFKHCVKKDSTPEPWYSERARQTPFVHYIKSFTISRQCISIKSHKGSWDLFTI